MFIKEKIIKFENEIDLKSLIKMTKNYNIVKCYLDNDLDNPKIQYGIIQMNEDDKIIEKSKEKDMIQKEFQKYVVERFEEQKKFNEFVVNEFKEQKKFNQYVVEQFEEQKKFNQYVIEQFEEQKKFNEFVVNEFKEQKKFNQYVIEQFEEQKKFNKLFLNRLDSIEKRVTILESFHEKDIKDYKLNNK